MLNPSRSRRPLAALRRGFTLLEILVVLAIIGLLVGVLVNQVGGGFKTGQEATARIFVTSTINTALVRYRINLGDYPSTSEGLEALVNAPSGKADRWKGPYLDKGKLAVDPWGEPYGYRYPGTRNKTDYDAFSKGADKAEGTPDDIGNWE
ncbi:MAG: type II secretion system major pseudopilin GspG [Burkholderiales bacterium]|nr:type II secretion system major pseudopilin GspG [Opitutaceae bacterium]